MFQQVVDSFRAYTTLTSCQLVKKRHMTLESPRLSPKLLQDEKIA